MIHAGEIQQQNVIERTHAMNTPLQHKAVSNPQAFSYQTMRLMELVAPNGGDGADLISTSAADGTS